MTNMQLAVVIGALLILRATNDNAGAVIGAVILIICGIVRWDS